MDSERIWAPWRAAYVGRTDESPAKQEGPLHLPEGADPDCFFCRDAADTSDRKNLVVHRGPHCITILNRYPYNNGHVLIAPLEHKADLSDLSESEQAAISGQIVRLTHILRETMNADGFNIGLNLGAAAGAGVPGHLHWHLVPRWWGDTNFMPAVAGARVIPQSLEALWDLLTSALADSS